MNDYSRMVQQSSCLYDWKFVKVGGTSAIIVRARDRAEAKLLVSFVRKNVGGRYRLTRVSKPPAH